MAAEVSGRIRPTKPKKQQRARKRKREDVDVEKLEQAVRDLDTHAKPSSFADLPLSAATSAGLQSSHFATLTDIQAQAIPHVLKGGDILGAAKTGSGKTLAFLVPVLENLYRAQCAGADAGLGAMVISPTRELAVQIFEVLRKVGGKGHVFAAGLIIGGKSLREEQDALSRMNIVVCTPGRILQHLSQTSTFNVDNLRMLVLDEADRIMDMGFQKDVDAIIEYLPPERQTLLFSATQTKRVSDLSRLALKNPEYISVHQASTAATPQTLQQNYILTPLPDKMDTLWSFLQSSKKSKILVFLSSGKQVRFVYEAFRQMQPGIPLLHLHGRQKQTARLEVTQRFSRAKHSCLFATDVVARGLDFPAVDWVTQVDCPEDADTYIHRVGRTARYEKTGRAVLFLDPSEEEGMLTRLAQRKVPIERINVRTKKQQSIKNQLQHMCLKDPTIKYLGQKAFTSYVRSLHVQKEKDIFQLDRYALEDFAASLGLPGAPRIKFLKADVEEVKRKKNAPRMAAHVDASEIEDEEGEDRSKAKVRTKYDRMFERRNQDILADHYTNLRAGGGSQSEDDSSDNDDGADGLLGVKRRIAVDNGSDDENDAVQESRYANGYADSRQVQVAGMQDTLLINSKRRENLLKSKKKLLKLKDKGSKVVFDEYGNAHQVNELDDETDFRASGHAEDQRKRFLEAEVEKVRLADVADKAAIKEKRKAKRDARRERERQEMEDSADIELDGARDVMADFVADAADAANYDDSEERKELPIKKKPKWFEQEHRVRVDEVGEIDTLDDLEAEATRLLG